MLDIPGYRIERQIGQGGMATVYLAVQESLDRLVALKVLNSPNVPGFSERFLREGRTIAALSHANIATVFDIGIHSGIHYISMEYVTGGDLKQRIQEGVTRDFALNTVTRIGSALHAAHVRGVVHRDVKPANILFRDDRTPLLTDFGIAKRPVSDGDLTATGELLGTPHYLSPEQAQNKELDGRVDMYSLGIVLYEMLVGDKPYHGDSDISIIFQQVYEPLPKLPADCAGLQILLDRMTAKDPDQRFDDMGQLLTAIEGESDPTASGEKHTRAARADTGPGLVPQTRPKGAGLMQRIARPTVLGISLAAAMAVMLYITRPALQSDTGVKQSVDEVRQRSPVVVRSMPPVEPGIASTGSTADSTVVAVPHPDPEAATAKPGTGSRDVSVREGATGNDERIENYLALGNARLRESRLTTPVGDSAVTYYQRALELDPGNAEARRGLIRIADRYAVLADQQIARGGLRKARQYVDTGLQVDPFHSRLRALDRRLMIQTGSQRIVRGVENFIRDMKDKIER